MKCLIDSHVVVWWLSDPQQLSKPAREMLEDGFNTIYISAASIWELGLKIRRGKLEMPGDYVQVLREDGFAFLDISVDHVEMSQTLPDHHNDPFDRLLIGQAKHERLLFITRDESIHTYDIPLLRA